MDSKSITLPFKLTEQILLFFFSFILFFFYSFLLLFFYSFILFFFYSFLLLFFSFFLLLFFSSFFLFFFSGVNRTRTDIFGLQNQYSNQLNYNPFNYKINYHI